MTSSPKQCGYQGHTVFHNQPSYKYFNKSFEDLTDAIFLGLNEIHPHFLREKQLKKDSSLLKLIDPRSKQPVTQFYIDHTKRHAPAIFKSLQHTSKMTKEQHVVSLRVMQALRHQQEVSEADLLVYRRSTSNRETERIEFLKFINEFSQTQRERIYAPVSRLVTLYVDWYRKKIELLISLTENTSYNTQSGLPHISACAKSDQNIEVTDVQVLERKGLVPVWNQEETNLTILSRNLETFSSLSAETPVKLEEHTTTASGELENVGGSNFKIPLDALLFLFTAGDYIDLPTEVMLDINSEGPEKVISFHTMLPARNCGWHTNAQVVDHAFQAFQSFSPQKKWLRFDNGAAFVLQSIKIEEIAAGLGSIKREFQPQLFDDFLKNQQTIQQDSNEKLKLCTALVQWKLRDTCSGEEIQINTALPQPPALDENAKDFLGGFTIKLEYKPQFGCEVMTKYELLKEWLILRLLASNKQEVVLQRLRVSASNFETLLSERLVCSQIEHELSTVYSVKLPRLLSGLYEFLKMLQRIPSGRYILRYNAKFRDKLMLCAPSQEITRNTIFLHSLMQTEPNNLAFMTQNHFLPIDNDLCSAMHLYHKVLPCAFKPLLHSTANTAKGRNRRNQTNPKCRPLSDRDYVLSRVQKKAALVNAKEKQQEIKRKRLQKARRRSRLRDKKEAERKKQQDEKELQQEIEFDKMIFGLS